MSCYFSIGILRNKDGFTVDGKLDADAVESAFCELVSYSRSSAVFTYLTEQYTSYGEFCKMGEPIDTKQLEEDLKRMKEEIDVSKQCKTRIDSADLFDAVVKNISENEEEYNYGCESLKELKFINKLFDEHRLDSVELWYLVG